MTNMIYRGVKHNGQRSAERAIAKDLIYRGVPHDGMAAAPAARPAAVAMCYRGVRYVLQAHGEIAWIDPLTPAVGSGAVAMQTA